MFRRDQPFRPSYLAVLALLPLVLVACGGGSGGGPATPTDPGPGTTLSLSTDWGDVTVYTNGLPFDPSAARTAIAAGYEKGRAQIGDHVDRFRLDGYHIAVMPADWANGSLYGQHLRAQREIRMRTGVERVLTHELQHVFAWDLGRFDDCKVYQDHPHGYDLLCGPLP